MIHGFNLIFIPQNQKEIEMINNLINKQKKTYKNTIKISIDKSISMFIFQEEKLIQFRIYDVAEYLNKTSVDNKDYIIFYSKFNSLIKKYKLSLDQLILTRIDYKLDLHLPWETRQEYLYCFSKLRKKYYSVKKKVYKNKDGLIETVYFRGSKYGFNFQSYDKDMQMQKLDIKRYNSFLQDVLRIEFQAKKQIIKAYAKKNGTNRELINFWHTSVRDEFFNEYIIEKFLYKGDYYNLDEIKKKLSNQKLSTQEKIIKFCQNVIKSDITFAQSKHKSAQTSKKFIDVLQQMAINPIPTKTVDTLIGIETILKQILSNIQNEKMRA